MKRVGKIISVVGLCFFLWMSTVYAHFGAIIPSDDIVIQEDSKIITIDVKFFHPMENAYMNMAKPVKFGVLHNGKKINLLNTLKEKKVNGFSTWQTTFKITRPGDYTFYIQPQPYWEPAEDCYIVHYAKVCVDALGLEEGWDDEVGLETEIVPLTRPYGLWTGNVFRGIVKLNGKPVPYAEIEVEYYNEDGKVVPPADPYVTQVIKADENGVFCYAIPKAGWWGFAALNTADWTLKGPDGKEKPVEIGAVYWVRVVDMKFRILE